MRTDIQTCWFGLAWSAKIWGATTKHIQTPLLPFHDCLSDHDRSWTRMPSHPAWRSVTWSSSSRERLARLFAVGDVPDSCIVLRYSPDSFVPQRYAKWLDFTCKWCNWIPSLGQLRRSVRWLDVREMRDTQESFISARCCNVRFRVKHSFCLKACNPLASVTSLKFLISSVVLAYTITSLISPSWQLQEATPFTRVTVKDISSRLETIDCQTNCKDL